LETDSDIIDEYNRRSEEAETDKMLKIGLQ